MTHDVPCELQGVCVSSLLLLFCLGFFSFLGLVLADLDPTMRYEAVWRDGSVIALDCRSYHIGAY